MKPTTRQKQIPLPSTTLEGDPDEIITCALISTWSKQLGIAQSTLRRRLKDSPYVEGYLHNSKRLAKGYAEEDVLRLCADLIEKRKEMMRGLNALRKSLGLDPLE